MTAKNAVRRICNAHVEAGALACQCRKLAVTIIRLPKPSKGRSLGLCDLYGRTATKDSAVAICVKASADRAATTFRVLLGINKISPDCM